MATGTIKGGITSTTVTDTPNADSSVKYFYQKSGNLVSLRIEGIYRLATGQKHKLCAVPTGYMPIQRDSENSQLVRMSGNGVANNAINGGYVLTIESDGYVYYITSNGWVEVMTSAVWFTVQ